MQQLKHFKLQSTFRYRTAQANGVPSHNVKGERHLIIEATQSHSDTPQSVRLFWTSDQLNSEICNRQHTVFRRDRLLCTQRDSKPQSQQSERQQTHILDGAVTGIGNCALLHSVITNGSLLAFYPIVVSRKGMKSCMLTVVYFSILQRKLGILLSHEITQEPS
jgi:hypothetical protein